MDAFQLTRDQTLEYMSCVRDLESTLYTQQQMLNKLTEKQSERRKKLKELESAGEPKMPKEDHTSVLGHILFFLFFPEGSAFLVDIEGIASFFAWLGGYLLTLIVVSLVSTFVLEHIPAANRMLAHSFLASWTDFGNGLGAALAGFFIGFVIEHIATFLWGLVTLPSTIHDNKKEKVELPQKMQTWQQELQQYHTDIAVLNDQGSKLNEWFRAVDSAKRQTQDSLNRAYSVNILAPKYRGLIPVCTMFEYLATGRCTSLHGYEGAYNLYENELRMNAIVTRLDDIEYKLDEIRMNQHALMETLDSISYTVQSSLTRVDQSLQRAQASADAAAYYSEIAARNSRDLMDLERIRRYR